MKWHLLSGEYPPSCGGVGDYTAQLASALADAGDDVRVWVPGASASESRGVSVVRLPDAFGTQSRAMLAEAWSRHPGIVLLQYVPNALGSRGANLAFCRWLVSERRAGVDVRVMFHEPYFYFSLRRPWRNALAIVQRRMAATLIEAATRVYYSSASWERYLRSYGAPDDARTLPIPSTIPGAASAADVASFRDRFGGSPVVGHFGTFGRDVASALLPALSGLVERNPSVNVALIGERSEEFRRAVAARAPNAAIRVFATGRLAAGDVAAALRACDVLLQPYPDGVTTRRTTVMAGLRNGVATVTTDGALTEAVWRNTRAVALAPAGDTARMVEAVIDLLGDAAARGAQGRRGADVYERCFSIEHAVAALRGAVRTAAPVAGPSTGSGPARASSRTG